MPSLLMISILTYSVTVAVSARMGVLGKRCLIVFKLVYSLRNYLPQVDTQCTSSITTRASCPLR